MRPGKMKGLKKYICQDPNLSFPKFYLKNVITINNNKIKNIIIPDILHMGHELNIFVLKLYWHKGHTDGQSCHPVDCKYQRGNQPHMTAQKIHWLILHDYCNPQYP